MLKTITINAIIDYIENNLELMQINTDTLVDYSGYSRRYLQILFTKIMGIPVGKYIQLRRITRAAILLRLTNLTIADISERLFFDSQQTFTREFKKNTGFTPYNTGKVNSGRLRICLDTEKRTITFQYHPFVYLNEKISMEH